MMTNAEKIARWRDSHPGERLTARAVQIIIGANLRGANLRCADLRGADLLGSFPISTPSGKGLCFLTPDGPRLSIGCWRNKSVADLRALLADEAEWPEAEGAERERRRPFLAAVLAQAEATEVYYADYLADLAGKWGER